MNGNQEPKMEHKDCNQEPKMKRKRWIIHRRPRNPIFTLKTLSENSVSHDCPYQIYAMAVFAASHHNRRHYNIAIRSFIEDPSNRVDIFSFDEETISLKPIPTLSFEHPYPPTKLMFQPPNPRSAAELLTSSSDYLHIWEVRDSSIEPLSTLNNSKINEFAM